MSEQFRASIIIGLPDNMSNPNTKQAVNSGLIDSFMTEYGMLFGMVFESAENYTYINTNIHNHEIDKLSDEFFTITGQDANVYLALVRI